MRPGASGAVSQRWRRTALLRPLRGVDPASVAFTRSIPRRSRLALWCCPARPRSGAGHPPPGCLHTLRKRQPRPSSVTGPGPDDVQRREGVIVRAGLPCRRCRRESIGPFAEIGNQHEVAVNHARRDQSKAAPTGRDRDTSRRSAVSRRSGRASARTRPALNAVPAPVCDGSVCGAIPRCASRDPASLRSPRS